MENTLMTLFLIDCVVMIACVMMQPAKNDNDSMSALTGEVATSSPGGRRGASKPLCKS